MASPDAIHLQWLLLGGFPNAALGGLALNLGVALAAFACSFLLGHALAFGRLSRVPALRMASTAYVQGMRSVPLLIVLFWFYFSLPILLRSTPSPLWSAVVALSAYGAAYQAEFIRAGILAVAPGEVEAARSLGLSRAALWWHVLLPQAHRRMLATYVSYFTSLFKDTSALYIVGLVELMQSGLIAAERQPGRMLQAYATVAALFFVVCWLATRAGRLLEHRLAQPRARPSHHPRPIAPQEHHHAHA
jgi:polar amino acid transport system permease protein